MNYKFLAVCGILLISLILNPLALMSAGLSDNNIEAAQLASIIFGLVFVFMWLHYDELISNYRRSPLFNIGIVTFGLIFMPIYLYRSRSSGERWPALLKFFGLCLLCGFISTARFNSYGWLPNLLPQASRTQTLEKSAIPLLSQIIKSNLNGIQENTPSVSVSSFVLVHDVDSKYNGVADLLVNGDKYSIEVNILSDGENLIVKVDPEVLQAFDIRFSANQVKHSLYGTAKPNTNNMIPPPNNNNQSQAQVASLLQDNDAISVSSSDLVSDPAHPSIIHVNLLIANQARYAEAYPHIKLTLTDTQNAIVARRIFTPKEYLPSAAKRAAGIAAGTEASVDLTLNIGTLAAAGYRVLVFYP